MIMILNLIVHGYYLGKKFEDEFLSVAIELGYSIYLKKWMKFVLLLYGKNQMLQQMLKELLRDIYLIFWATV